MIDLELLEDYGNAPDSRAHYLVQTDETRDARCAFTAHAIPQLRALGFIGILALGDHHTTHHLQLAKGDTPAGHSH